MLAAEAGGMAPVAAPPAVDPVGPEVPPMVDVLPAVPPVPDASALPVVPEEPGVPVAEPVEPVPAVLPVAPPGVVVVLEEPVVVSVPAWRLQAASDRQAPSSTASATLRFTEVFVIRELLGLRLSWVDGRPRWRHMRKRYGKVPAELVGSYCRTL